MAIVYPLALPAELHLTNRKWMPRTAVGVAESPFTFETQTFVWPGQAWAFQAQCPPVRNNASADALCAFFLALNGTQGTFTMGDSTRPTTRGTAAGAWTVGVGAAMLSTTLPTVGAGALVVGDWLQINTDLYRVIKKVDDDTYDLWPRLRTAYANGTTIIYTGALGRYRLANNNAMAWAQNLEKHHAFQLDAIEDK